MKNKAWKKLLAAVLTVCMIISVLPVSTLAATSVTPEPAQGGAENLLVEYFPTTFIDYNQEEANKAAQAADIKPGTTTTKWVTANPSWYALTSSEVEHKNTGYYVLVDGEYYPAYITMTRTTTSYVYYTDSYALTYLKDGQYIKVGEYETDRYGLFGTSSATSKYPDVPLYERQETTTAAEQQGRGFYFTTDKGGKPGEAYIPLFSKTWGKNKTDGPAIPGGQANGDDDPNNKGQDQDFYIYSGLAAAKLSESTNAPFANDVNAAPGFFSTDPTVGTGYRAVYTNVGVPYVYDEKTGNYTLDSDKNGVYFEGGIAKSNTNMMIADLPSAIKMNGDGQWVTGLAPFVGAKSTAIYAAPSGRDNVGGTSTDKVAAYQMDFSNNNATADEQLFAFGMVTEVKFQMTDDGMSPINGEPINFNFSGDDDVWVYIDGVLALDIGGVHDAIKGNINFVTGKVTVSAPNSRIGKVGDRATNPTMDNRECVASLNQGNIYDKLNTTLIGFAAQGEHTLTIYYMERGEGKTNCLIQFNLPQRDTVSVTKVIDKSKGADGNTSTLTEDEQAKVDGTDFGFTLYNDGNRVANKTYYVYDKDNTQSGSRSTNAQGHFTLRNGQTAKFLVDIDSAEGSSYYVVEDAANGYLPPKYTCTTSITNNSNFKTTQNADGWTSMKVTAIGSDTAADDIGFVCENYLDVNLANPSVIPDTERIVIDYGLPITIDKETLLEGDIYRGDEIVFNGLAELIDPKEEEKDTNGEFAYNAEKELVYVSVPVFSYEGEFGTATYDATTGNITYTLNKQLTGIETLYYKVTVKGKGNTGDQETTASVSSTGKILIMPATSMYYEENFGTREEDKDNKCIKYGLVTYSDRATEWLLETVEDANYGNQETGFVGTVNDSTYGSDEVYMNHTGDSYGTSMHASTNNAAAKFEYDFTGTGTAIYGRVSTDTGYIRVKITDRDSHNDVVDWQYIDTVEIASVGDADKLFNIPIYINTDLAKPDTESGDEVDSPENGDETVVESELEEVTKTKVGNYHVEVLVYKKGTPTNREGGSGSEFYLDGIRIYNPVLNNDIVNTAYSDDGEANTVVINIRDKINADIDENVVDKESVFTLTDKYGTVITDEANTNGDADYQNYVDYGPNNEFYLNTAPTDDNRVYTISFKLINWDSTLYKLYLGMKAPAGKASVKVDNTVINLNNSTDCYYDISNYITVSKEERIANVATVTISGNEGLASLTNLKVTGKEAFELTTPPGENIEAGKPDPTPETETDSAKARVLYIAPATYSLSDNSGAILPDEDETVFEETEFDDTESNPEETEKDEETTEDTDKVEIDTIPDDSIEGEADTDKDKIDIEVVPSDKVEIEIIPDEDADVEFTPDLFRTDCSYKSRLKTATISVMTSTDVSYITVDGKKVSGTKMGNVRIYLDIRTRVKSGTSFEIIAYDENGNASEVYTVTAD